MCVKMHRWWKYSITLWSMMASASKSHFLVLPSQKGCRIDGPFFADWAKIAANTSYLRIQQLVDELTITGMSYVYVFMNCFELTSGAFRGKVR